MKMAMLAACLLVATALAACSPAPVVPRTESTTTTTTTCPGGTRLMSDGLCH